MAIDPGSSKMGMAVVRRVEPQKTEVLWRCVCSSEELEKHIDEARDQAPYSMVIVGNGTKSKEVVSRLREHMPSIGILVVDERDTSQQAREKYWEYNPRRGWRRLLPASLQTPPAPVDDFVAIILAERVLLEE
ncbi:MAG: pre-16S rRNA-processing nuclease YqgF [Armatimonadetes bacterium]|nr:pre-16S rRNA-processing nuclease YqgF [Armatimonadota bacterium]